MPEGNATPPAPVRQLLAVIYGFEDFRDGERRLMLQQELPASAFTMLEQQLEAVPKRSLVDYGPGLLVYSNFQHARFAAQTVAKVAAYVALREVVAGAEPGADVWPAANGGRYSSVPGGLAETIKE